MIKTYTFECYDDETGNSTSKVVRINDEIDSWTGYEGPMWQFFDFLKGCGFVFHHNAEIGVMDYDKDKFVSAADPLYDSQVSFSWGEEENE